MATLKIYGNLKVLDLTKLPPPKPTTPTQDLTESTSPAPTSPAPTSPAPTSPAPTTPAKDTVLSVNPSPTSGTPAHGTVLSTEDGEMIVVGSATMPLRASGCGTLGVFPREIRDMIYEFVLSDEDLCNKNHKPGCEFHEPEAPLAMLPITTTFDRLVGEEESPEKVARRTMSKTIRDEIDADNEDRLRRCLHHCTRRNLSLLSTSKDINKEAVEVFYKSNSICLSDRKEANHILSANGIPNLSYARDLMLWEANLESNSWGLFDFYELLKSMPQLRRVELPYAGVCRIDDLHKLVQLPKLRYVRIWQTFAVKDMERVDTVVFNGTTRRPPARLTESVYLGVHRDFTLPKKTCTVHKSPRESFECKSCVHRGNELWSVAHDWEENERNVSTWAGSDTPQWVLKASNALFHMHLTGSRLHNGMEFGVSVEGGGVDVTAWGFSPNPKPDAKFDHPQRYSVSTRFWPVFREKEKKWLEEHKKLQELKLQRQRKLIAARIPARFRLCAEQVKAKQIEARRNAKNKRRVQSENVATAEQAMAEKAEQVRKLKADKAAEREEAKARRQAKMEEETANKAEEAALQAVEQKTVLEDPAKDRQEKGNAIVARQKEAKRKAMLKRQGKSTKTVSADF